MAQQSLACQFRVEKPRNTIVDNRELAKSATCLLKDCQYLDEKLREKWAVEVAQHFEGHPDAPRPHDFLGRLDGSVERLPNNPAIDNSRRYPCRFQIPPATLHGLNDEEKTRRSERFALASLLYEIWLGAQPFEDLTDDEVQRRFSNADFPQDAWFSLSLDKALGIYCGWSEDFALEIRKRVPILQSIKEYAAAHPYITGVGMAGATVTGATLLAPAALGAIGFSALGPVSGTLATVWQSSIGVVQASSLFSWCQSAAMGGAALGQIHAAGAVGATTMGAAVSPDSAKALLRAGFVVRVEKSPERIYEDEEFAAAGAEMVPAGSWIDAPLQDVILGLKELPVGDGPLSHTYIHFQHCFKKQDGWASTLSRFARGNGKLYDLEFLTDENGRRVAAFGYWAGYAGTAIALLSWAHQILHPQTAQGRVPVFDSAPALAQHVKSAMQPALDANDDRKPRVIIIGALGRCGKGAIAFCQDAGIPEESILKWDLAETSRGGPFQEVAESDIFINCVYLGPHRTPPFATFESLSASGRRLRVICDVSCDPNSENNPIPIYSSYSTFDTPTIPTSEKLDAPELRIIAIDHLPTLVARESSDEFSQLLLPSLLNLDHRESDGVWKRAEQTYRDRVKELPKSAG
ncbi:MAG: hypothetical protein Q9227_002801 [Pyrenula ochraceoflavens]